MPTFYKTDPNNPQLYNAANQPVSFEQYKTQGGVGVLEGPASSWSDVIAGPVPTQSTSPAQPTPLTDLVGTRPSSADPNVTEYFNTQTQQGFANPQDLSTFVNQQGGSTTPQNVFDFLNSQKTLAQAQASGPAPQKASEATNALQTYASSGGSDAATRIADVDTQLAQDPAYQNLLKTQSELNSYVTQQKSLSETYKEFSKELGIDTMNTELMNMKNVIEGTEEDLRNEITKVGGFATESQVMALTNARNKQLVKNYNNLLLTKQMAQETLNTMVSLASQDREFAMQAIDQRLQIDRQIADYSIKMQDRARETYDNIVKQVGYEGLLKMTGGDPYYTGLVEKNLGLSSGGLQQLALVQQQQINLKAIQQAGITARYANVNGEIQDARTGYAFRTPEEFFAAAGVKNWEEANQKGLIQDLNQTGDLKKYPASYQEYLLAKKEGFTGNYNDYQTLDANRKAKASGAGILGGLFNASQINATVNQIAGAFDNEQTVKDFNILKQGYEFSQSLANDTQNPADDQGLIYAFAKAMDPGSVVREGEYATVQKYAQSLIKSYGKSVEQAINGTGFLSTEARQNIKKTIESKYKVSKQNYDNLYKQYQQRINNALSGQGNTLADYGATSTTPQHNPGDVISYGGIEYQVGSDGDTLIQLSYGPVRK